MSKQVPETQRVCPFEDENANYDEGLTCGLRVIHVTVTIPSLAAMFAQVRVFVMPSLLG